eukprot:4192573-Pleurochrysis_carterae.AAC.1
MPTSSREQLRHTNARYGGASQRGAASLRREAARPDSGPDSRPRPYHWKCRNSSKLAGSADFSALRSRLRKRLRAFNFMCRCSQTAVYRRGHLLQPDLEQQRRRPRITGVPLGGFRTPAIAVPAPTGQPAAAVAWPFQCRVSTAEAPPPPSPPGIAAVTKTTIRNCVAMRTLLFPRLIQPPPSASTALLSASSTRFFDYTMSSTHRGTTTSRRRARQRQKLPTSLVLPGQLQCARILVILYRSLLYAWSSDSLRQNLTPYLGRPRLILGSRVYATRRKIFVNLV